MEQLDDMDVVPEITPLDHAIGEYLSRVDAGELVSRDEFIASHAELRDGLLTFFADHDLALQFAGGRKFGQATDTSILSLAGTIEHRADPPIDAPSAVRRKEIPPTFVGPFPITFGQYTVQKMLGYGAMGEVYLAEDGKLGRQVALKVPRRSADESPEFLERFHREARACAKLRHQNICPIYEVNAIGDTHYIAMAFIDGQPLSRSNFGGLPNSERLAATIRKISLALDVAHRAGVVHRDLKPSNIMIDTDGEPIVMDFGLAQQSSDVESRITQEGTIVGTPAYMSPEQVRCEMDRIGPASDIYSLGVILYELLTGRLPFSGSMMQMLVEVIDPSKPPRPPSEVRVGIDPDLDAICLRMLSKSLEHRYQSMKEVAAALDETLHRTLAESERRPMTPNQPSGVVETPDSGSSSDGRLKWLHSRWVGVITTVGVLAIVLLWLKFSPPIVNEPQAKDSNSPISDNSPASRSPVAAAIPSSTNPEAQLSLAELLTSPDYEWSVPKKLDPVVNFSQYNYSPRVSSDGLQMWFVGNMGKAGVLGKGRDDLWFTRRNSLHSAWETPVNVGEPINGPSFERDFSLTADGCSLFFMRQNPDGVFVSTRTNSDQPWSVPKLVLGLYLKATHPVVSPDGLTLLISQPARSGGKGHDDIWMLTRQTMNDPWSTPSPLSEPLNSSANDWPCWLSADGTVLLLGSTRQAGFGEQDLWLSTRKTIADAWQKPVNLGFLINSSKRDEFAELASDGQTLWFVSDRIGSNNGFWNIWQSRRVRKPKVDSQAGPQWIAAHEILRHGGEVSVITDSGESFRANEIEKLSPHKFVNDQVHLNGWNTYDDSLDLIRGLKTVRRVELSMPVSVNPNFFERLNTLTDLEILSCAFVDIKDKEFADITKLTKLKYLYLWSQKISDVSLGQLDRLENLEVLTLGDNSDYDGTGLAQIKPMLSVSQIRFDYSRFADDAMPYLERFPNLGFLSLLGTKVTDKGLSHLKSFSRLQTLELSENPQLTDSWTKDLSQLSRLLVLVLNETNITDEALKNLATCQSLRELKVRKTKVTAEGIRQFKQALPKCIVESDFPNP